jgi:hypothetical protein
MNTYGYVGGNRLNRVDPRGLSEKDVCWGKGRTFHHNWICVDDACAGLMPIPCDGQSGQVWPEHN